MDEGDELLRRCQQGDESALADLVRSFQQRIIHLAYRLAGDPASAEEMTAQAFVKIWAKAGQWRGQSQASTWIYRLAVRTILDELRSRRRWWRRWSAPWPRLMSEPRPGPSEVLETRELQDERSQHLQQALGQLAETDRVLVHLYYFENKDLGEIEAILNVPRANLKMRLARARQRLRNLLEGDDESV